MRQYPDRLKKRHLKSLFGTYAAAAKALGVSKGAIGNYADDDLIPENHDLKIRYRLKPEAFSRSANRTGARP